MVGTFPDEVWPAKMWPDEVWPENPGGAPPVSAPLHGVWIKPLFDWRQAEFDRDEDDLLLML